MMLAGCTSRVNTTVNTETQLPEVTEPTSSPESMMNAPLATPVAQATPIDISADAQLKSTKPVGTSDDPKTLKSDLNSTTIVNENFN